jgi:hypothetical protein
MCEEGFLEVSRDAFYLPTFGILLTDAAPRNVRISGDSAIPFDAIAETASEEVIHWIGLRYETMNPGTTGADIIALRERLKL